MGIAPDQVGLIFDEFYQVGVSPNSSRDGYGLGLSIVQRIARLLELKVQVRSELGKGSMFSFELPRGGSLGAVRRRARRGGASSAEKAAGAARHILLVEDEPGVRNAMRMLLKIEGYRRHRRGDGATKRSQLMRGSNRFDLLVTDYHLEGGRTGTQVIAAAREILGADVQGRAGHR